MYSSMTESFACPLVKCTRSYTYFMKHVLNVREIVRGMVLGVIMGMSFFHIPGERVEGGEIAQHHMPMLEPAAESFAAPAAPLPTTGWTATASDQQSSHPVSYVLDGNTGTFWI